MTVNIISESNILSEKTLSIYVPGIKSKLFNLIIESLGLINVLITLPSILNILTVDEL